MIIDTPEIPILTVTISGFTNSNDLPVIRHQVDIVRSITGAVNNLSPHEALQFVTTQCRHVFFYSIRYQNLIDSHAIHKQKQKERMFSMIIKTTFSVIPQE